MIVGITGSRHGISGAQEAALRLALLNLGARRLLHGDCKGADEAAHKIALELGIEIWAYPPKIERWRAFSRGAAVEALPAPYLERNRLIVCHLAANNGILIALPEHPEGDPRSARSGTWATVRMARKARVRTLGVMR